LNFKTVIDLFNAKIDPAVRVKDIVGGERRCLRKNNERHIHETMA